MGDVSRFSRWLEDSMFHHGGMNYRYADLADDIGVSKNTISSWKNEKALPAREHIHKLAIHFGSTSRFIYELTGQVAPEDLNDTYEQVMAIVYRLTHSNQKELLKELEDRHGKPSDTDKKSRK